MWLNISHILSPLVMSSLVTLSYIIKAKFRRKCSPLIALLILFILNLLICCMECSFLPKASKCDYTQCLYGICIDNHCVCDTGWQGVSCDQCGGRAKLNSTFGYITDGTGNYSSNLQCTWLIDSGTSKSTIRLQFIHFETECSWDHLYIFDGDSIFSPMIAAFSGSLITDKHSTIVSEIVAQSGRAFIYFYSDAAYNMSGFNISYSINSCPRNCSSNGVCVGERCTCNAGFDGDSCEKPICPNDCSKNGFCDKTNHRCVCNYGYVGVDCSQEKRKGYWTFVSTTNVPGGRSLHQSAIYEDTMFVVGGEHFQPDEAFLLKYDMKMKKWDQDLTYVQPKRFGHSTIVFNHTVYVYGGILSNGTIVSELLAYSIIGGTWRTIEGKSFSNSEFCCPFASTGHTATLFNNLMIVIFGYNPDHGYLNHVQHYNIDKNEWKLVKTTGASVKGGYGHSSTYDHVSRLIYVYGGYHSSSFADNILVDFLYAYNPKHESWILLSPSKSPRYLHSASIINGLLLIFGGNGHNNTDDNAGEICFSPKFLAYDISCDSWKTLDDPVISNVYDKTTFGRYGHSSVVYEDALYIFGGFNGIMHNSLLKYTPGNCSNYDTLEECNYSKIGVKCVWNNEKSLCQSFQQVKAFSNFCEENKANFTELCSKQKVCSTCLRNSYNCVWCDDTCYHEKCNSKSTKDASTLLSKALSDARMCKSVDLQISNCDKMHNCYSCQFEHNCSWKISSQTHNKNKQKDRYCISLNSENRTIENKLKPEKHSSSDDGRTFCEVPCHTRLSCENCTQGSCMWCSSQKRCIESNAYSVIYPIGQCMEWTTHSFKCSVGICSDIQSCDKCLKNPQCGWCDNGSSTGVGVCLEGSSRGPFVINSTHKFVEAKRCHASNWHFTHCPKCQCNGHSKCSVKPNVCNIPCDDFTEGSNCENCIEGFYGKPINGGTCIPCSCNGHSDLCNHETGKCNCTTKGITGHQCDKCDEQNNYFGNPQDISGSCYYNLSTSFSYTFNVSKPDDKYYTRINFINMPLSTEIDVEFAVQCQENAIVNISVGSGFNSTLEDRRRLYETMICGNIKLRFTNSDHFYGIHNTTFFVSVYNFKTPFILQISFSQHRNIDILQFFLTFSSCFLALLIVAAILWKIKQKYEIYRRRQQLFVEMEQMASRPFAGVVIQVKNDITKTNVNNNPTPIALEPCGSGKAAVLTLVVKLPTGNQQLPLSGQTGIALASALVTLGNVSLEPNSNKEKNSFNKVSTNQTKLNDLTSSYSTGV